MKYIHSEKLKLIFRAVGEEFANKEEVPDFLQYPEAISKLISVIDGAKADRFYKDIYEKATHIFIQINKGHFFPNGNKRLALVTTLFFLFLNNIQLKGTGGHTSEKDRLIIIFKRIFPQDFIYEDYPEFQATESVLYNLSIFVADSHKYIPDFSELKKKVADLFREILIDNA